MNGQTGFSSQRSQASVRLQLLQERSAHILEVQRLRQSRLAARAAVQQTDEGNEIRETRTDAVGTDRSRKPQTEGDTEPFTEHESLLDPPSISNVATKIDEVKLYSDADPVQAQLQELIKRSHKSQTGAEYYAVTARLLWLATKGELGWAYLPTQVRKLELDDIEALMKEEGCPEDARRMMQDCLNELVSKGALDLILSDADDDATDLYEDLELRGLVNEMEQVLLDRILEGKVFAKDEQRTLLAKVEVATMSRIGYSKRMMILSYALFLWPTRAFDVDSRALQQFCADFRAETQDSLTSLRAHHLDVGKGAGQIPLATLARTGERTPKILTTLQARRYLDQPKRCVAPDTDDVEYVESNKDWFKDRIYDEFVSLPQNAEEYQLGQWADFELAFSNRMFTLKTIEAKSILIVEATLDLHKDGCRFNETVDWGMKSATADLDNNMTCSQRLEHLIEHLAHKAVCEDVLLNEQWLNRFVIAPNAVLRLKKKSGQQHGWNTGKMVPHSSTVKFGGNKLVSHTSGQKRKAASKKNLYDDSIEDESPTKKAKGTKKPSTVTKTAAVTQASATVDADGQDLQEADPGNSSTSREVYSPLPTSTRTTPAEDTFSLDAEVEGRILRSVTKASISAVAAASSYSPRETASDLKGSGDDDDQSASEDEDKDSDDEDSTDEYVAGNDEDGPHRRRQGGRGQDEAWKD